MKPKFTIRDLCWLTLVVALAAGYWQSQREVRKLHKQRNHDVRAIYDAQKWLADKLHKDFVQQLIREGYRVEDRSQRFAGSGEWGHTIHLLLSSEKKPDTSCFVDVEGFVENHWVKKLPELWTGNLPMSIAYKDGPQEQRLVSLFKKECDALRWDYHLSTIEEQP